MPDYVFFDVETPNCRNARICSIGVVVTNADGEIKYENYWLVNPEEGFDPFNVNLHGIVPGHVLDAPTFLELWNSALADVFDGSTLVAHNAMFDMSVLNKVLDWYGIPFPDVRIIDTMTIAKHCLTGMDSYGLESTCERLRIPLEDHHNALCDAKACESVFFTLMRGNQLADYQGNNFEWRSYEDLSQRVSSNIGTAMTDLYGITIGIAMDNVIDDVEAAAIRNWMERYSSYRETPVFRECFSLIKQVLADGIITSEEQEMILEFARPFLQEAVVADRTAGMQELLGLLRGVSADGIINKAEAISMNTWVDEHAYLRGDRLFDKIDSTIERVLEDGVVTAEESSELVRLISRLTNPSQMNTDAYQEKSCPQSLEGKAVCLTGDFAHGSKDEISTIIEQAGGLILKGVTKKCNYVVIGELGSEKYAFGNYGTKVKKAMEYKEIGIPIEIIRETDLFALLG